MAWLLGSITLPNPSGFNRAFIEKSQKIVTLNNTTKKDITGRKEVYTLAFKMLTQTEVNNILSEYNLQTTRTFQVTEANLTIPATTVHIEMNQRGYNTPGGEYREDIVLVLEEAI